MKYNSSRSDEIESLFEQILLICDEQGLLGHELFAIDGCKMSSNAAKEWSGSFEELEHKREKIKRQIQYRMEAHRKLDKHETRDETRIKRREQTIETLNAASERIDRFLKTHSPGIGQGKRPGEVKRNITDNESAKMKTSKGVIQGYNGLATVDKKHQIIIDAQAFGEGQEQHTLQPILESIQERYQRLGMNGNIYQAGADVTADTGFASETNMAYLHNATINAYVPDNQFRNRNPKSADHRKGKGRQVSFIVEKGDKSPNHTDWMNLRVDSPKGKEIYSHRMSVVEPVFGNIGTNKRLNRFSLRGKRKVQGQWQLYCLVHNIEKIANRGALLN